MDLFQNFWFHPLKVECANMIMAGQPESTPPGGESDKYRKWIGCTQYNLKVPLMKMIPSMLDVEEAGGLQISLRAGKLVEEYRDKNVSFHTFPKNNEFYQIWKHRLRIGKKVPNQARVCSVHFSPRKYRYSKEDSKKKRLQSDAVPTRNLPKSSIELKKSESAQKRLAERAERLTKRNFKTERSLLPEFSASVNQNLQNAEIVPLDAIIDHGNQNLHEPQLECIPTFETFAAEIICPEETDRSEEVIRVEETGHSEEIICVEETDRSEESCFTQQDHEFLSNVVTLTGSESLLGLNNNVYDNSSCTRKKVDTADIGVQVNTLFPGESRFLDFVTKDAHVTYFTNLASLDEFQKLASLLEEVLVKIHYNVSFKLDIGDMLFLTLMKLKLDLSFKCISVLFKISYTTVASYFNFIIDLLSQSLPIPWPPQERIRQTVPYCFKKYKNTRIILDCSETKVETPACALCRIKLYSHYKGGPTIKYEVGISPNGLITYISPAYGGRASDSFIVRDSGILNKLEYSDAVMTDKGFLIEKDCEECGVQLIRPPFLRSQKQLTKSQAVENQCIASARVHVERAIQRMKSYAILKNTFAWDLVNRVDKILHVICALVNLQKPIIDPERGQSKKSFLQAQNRLKTADDLRKQL